MQEVEGRRRPEIGWLLDRPFWGRGYATEAAAAEYTASCPFINCDEKAFLSATGRSDDRVLYALNDSDLQFYLEINHLEPMLQLVPQLKIALTDFTEAVM